MAASASSDTSNVINVKSLTLGSPETEQEYTIYLPEDIEKRVHEDASDSMSSMIFNKIVAVHTVNGNPKKKVLGLLGYIESMEILSQLDLLKSVVESAKNASHMTITKQTRFDAVSTTAYNKDLQDQTLERFCSLSPADFTPRQKVRFMEMLAASMPEDSSEAEKTAMNSSPASETASETVETSQSPTNTELEESVSAGRVIWTHEAIMMLIDSRRELSHLFESNTTTQKQAWRKVADLLKEKGHKFTEDDCSKKFRSLRARYKTIKEKNNKTGNSRQTWRYFETMDAMFQGDPAVIPITVVSSLPVASHSSQETELDELATISTPKAPRKRRKSGMEPDALQFFKSYQDQQQKWHDERMTLERERIDALKTVFVTSHNL